MSALINIGEGSVIEHVPLAHLSAFMNPPEWWTMAVLRAYLDDSGDPSQEWLTIAGFSFVLGESESFERKWREALDFAGIPYLHMKEMNKGKSPFKELKEDPEKEKLFFQSIINIIDHGMDACVGSSVKVSDLRAFNEEHKLNLDPYALGIYGCLLNLRIASPKVHQDKIEIIVDRFDRSRKRINLGFDYEETDTTHLKQGNIVFAKEDILDPDGFKAIYQLQAADFLAWELNKNLRDNSGFNPSYEIRQNRELLEKAQAEFEREYERKHGKKPRLRKSYSELLKAVDGPFRTGLNVWTIDDLEAAHARHPNGWIID